MRFESRFCSFDNFRDFDLFVNLNKKVNDHSFRHEFVLIMNRHDNATRQKFVQVANDVRKNFLNQFKFCSLN